MKKAIGAVLWHSTEFADRGYQHRFCPSGTSSWCKWKRDQEDGAKKYRQTTSIPIWIHELLKPIFTDLSSDELLKKCLHGKMQNANEALNNIKCPKNVYVEKDVLELSVNSAVLDFNEGPSGIHSILNHFNIDSGIFTKISSAEKLKARVRGIIKKESEEVKRRRKQLRSMRKGYLDREKEEQGGESYVPGAY